MAHLDLVHRLFCVRKTVLNMLKARGYLVGIESQDSLETFKMKVGGENPDREKMTIFRNKKDDPTANIYVFFASEQKLGVKPIHDYCLKMKSAQNTTAIIVVPGTISAFAKQAIAELAPKYNITHFSETELLVDITEHILVPEHIRLSKEEKKNLLDKYKLKESQLPRIQVTDPIARYYGLEKGEVVKIIRTSETAGKYITYRLVN